MRKRSSTILSYAPKCALPVCTTPVNYHKQYSKKNGSPGAKWKMFCEYHRTTGKAAVDKWKMDSKCSNTDAHHGFKCTATITHSSQIDINHIDGDRHNNDPKNLECLCKNCHARVTIENEHHLNRYENTNTSYDKFFTPIIDEEIIE